MQSSVIAQTHPSDPSDTEKMSKAAVRAQAISHILSGLIDILDNFRSDFQEGPEDGRFGEDLCDLLTCLYGFTEQLECRVSEYQRELSPTESLAPTSSAAGPDGKPGGPRHERAGTPTKPTHPTSVPATSQRAGSPGAQDASGYPDIDSLEILLRSLADECFRTLAWLCRPNDHTISKGALAHLVKSSNDAASILSHPKFEAAAILRANQARIDDDKQK